MGNNIMPSSLRSDDFEVNPAKIENDQQIAPNVILHELKVGHIVESLAYSPDGSYVAIGGRFRKVSIFDTFSQEKVHDYEENKTLYTICYSQDSKFLAIGGESKSVKVYNAKTHELEHVYERHTWVFSASFSPDGSLIGIAGDDGTIAIYNTSTRKLAHEHKHDDSMFRITFSRCGTYYAVGGWDCKVTIYLTADHSKLHEHHVDDRVYAISFSPNSDFLAFGGDNNFAVCNTFTHDIAYGFDVIQKEKKWNIRAIEYSPDGNFVSVREDDLVVMVYDATTFAAVFRYERGNSIRAIAYAPNGNFSIGGDDALVATYDAAILHDTFFHEYKLDDDENVVASSPDHALIATGGRNRKVSAFNFNSGELVFELKRSDTIFAITFSPNGELIAVGGKDKIVAIYETYHQKLVHEYVHEDWIYNIVYRPQGDLIAVGRRDCNVSIYNSISHELIYEFRNHSSVMSMVFCSSLNCFVAGGHETVKLIGASNGKLVENYSQDSTIRAIAYDEEHDLISCGGDNGKFRVYRASTHQRVHECQLGHGKICSLSFSGDGKILAIGTDNGSLIFLTTKEWLCYISSFTFPEAVTDILFVMDVLGKHNMNQYYIAISCGNVITTMTLHSLTTTPVEVIMRFNDEEVLQLLDGEGSKKMNQLGVLTRNHKGQTLISYTAQMKRSKLLSEMCKLYPSTPFVPNHNGSNTILTYLEECYLLVELRAIITSKFPKISASHEQLQEMVEAIRNLANDDAKAIVVDMLDSCDQGSIKGFALAGELYCLKPPELSYWRKILPWQKAISQTLSNQRQRKAQPLTEKMDPRSSDCAHVATHSWEDLAKDKEKRVKLSVLRSLLPNLVSFETLITFTNMSNCEVFESIAVSLAVTACWQRWARKRFLFHCFFYCVWLTLFSAFCEICKTSNSMRNNSFVLIMAAVISFGNIYLLYVEILKIRSLKLQGYWRLSNITQLIAISLTTTTMILRICFDVKEILNSIISAMALFCSWNGLLEYLKGFEEVAWITFALNKIAEKMRHFTLVLFVAILTFSFTLRALYKQRNEDTSDSRAFANIFTSLRSILFAGVAGMYEFEEWQEELYIADIILSLIMTLFLFMVSIISLNTLIAFISESFDTVLGQRNAICIKEKADVILNLYCIIGKKEREKLEDECRWTTVLIPSTDLDVIAQQYESVNRARVTKHDLNSLATKEDLEPFLLNQSPGTLLQGNEEVEKIKNDIVNMKQDISVMKGDINAIKNGINTLLSQMQDRSR